MTYPKKGSKNDKNFNEIPIETTLSSSLGPVRSKNEMHIKYTLKTIDFPPSLMNYSSQQFILPYSYDLSSARKCRNDAVGSPFFVVCMTFNAQHFYEH